MAAYQSLSGVDVFYWFSTGETEWSNQDRAPWDSASRSKWSIATPMILGQFPAAALMFRQRLSRAGPAGRRGTPLAGPDLGASAAGARRRSRLRPQPRSGRHGTPVRQARSRRPAGVSGRAGEGALRFQARRDQDRRSAALHRRRPQASSGATRARFASTTAAGCARSTRRAQGACGFLKTGGHTRAEHSHD